jgi:4-amino-4-deoxy-L-arabinose transferase-like glycosyltransferase
MNRKIIIIILSFVVVLSLFFNLYKRNVSPPGFNADEAAFGYNAYSILKTGRDEYRNFLPFRFKSFGENKLPLYGYLSIPSVALFGLSEDSTRVLNTLLMILLPLVIFFLVKELFEDDKVSLAASFFISVSLGLNVAGRHAHEALLATFFVTLSTLFFIKTLKRETLRNDLLFLLSLGLALFSYNSSRLFAFYFLVVTFFLLLRKKVGKFLFAALLVLTLVFLWTDVKYSPTRVKNVFFANNLGFSLGINELRGEGANRFIYNKLTVGIRNLTYEHVKYFSPQFLGVNGDENFRFGYPYMAPITLVEYFLALCGIFFLFKKGNKWRFFLVSLLLITPLPASLSYGGLSITRSLFMLVLLPIFSSYGLVLLLKSLVDKKLRYLVLVGIVLLELIFLFYSWDFYFNHYSKRPIVIQGWQAGYREMGKYLSDNYGNFDKFYITKKNGQPYIFTLFYLKYSPALYQKQAKLSAPDQYGFGQVESYDKFIFNFTNPLNAPRRTSIIGYPDDFQGINVDNHKIKKIIVGGQEIFWIYENN